MRGLRGVGVVLAAGITAAVAAAASATSTVPPRLPVTPASGHLHTRFTVHFTAPSPSGQSGGQNHAYRLIASPAHRRSGCIDSVSMAPTASSAGEAMAVRLRPRRLGGRWCAERYAGRVTETVEPACQPIMQRRTAVCPQYIALITIGRFSFRVRR
jgi:hypothetical protein